MTDFQRLSAPRLSHRDRILADLASGAWVCGAEWYAAYIPTFSQRISNINADEPGRIESRPCTQHTHRGSIHEYRDSTVTQLRLRGVA